MKKFPARGVWMTLSLCIITSSAYANDFGSPSLLYPQQGNSYPIAPAAYGRMAQDDNLPSPSDNPAHPMMNQGAEYGNGYDGGYQNYPTPPVPQSPAPCSGDYQQAMSSDWGDGCGCGTCGGGLGSCGRGGWFGYAGGLIMTRSQTGGMPLAYENFNQVLNTNQVEQPWMGGFEAAFGKWFNNGCTGLEVVYWGLFPSNQEYDYSGTNINSAIDYGSLQYNARPYNDYWQGSQRQYIRRENTFNNIELNLIGNAWNYGGGAVNAGYGGGCGSCSSCCDSGCGGCCSSLTVGWLAGVRYFDFTDNFYYASSDLDTVLDGTPDEVFYINNVKNQMVGFQMGGYLNYQLGCRFSLYGGAKAGLYNNHTNLYKRLYGTLGDATINDGGPYQGQAASHRTSANTLAALGQLDLGMRYQATCHLAFRAGYRVVGISGVALSDDQFLYNYNDFAAYNDIDTNGSVILHGAYAGGEFCW